MCPNIADFCSESFECIRGMAPKCFFIIIIISSSSSSNSSSIISTMSRNYSKKPYWALLTYFGQSNVGVKA